MGSARLRLALARDASTPVSLTAAQVYVGGVITLDTYRDVDAGDGVCGGCSTPACIVLNEIQLFQNAGAPGGDVQILSTPHTRRFVTWQGGLTGDCAAGSDVAGRPNWGTIRALYR